MNSDLDKYSHIEYEDIKYYVPTKLKLGRLKEINMINKTVIFEVNNINRSFSIEMLMKPELRKTIKMDNDTFISLYNILGNRNESR